MSSQQSVFNIFLVCEILSRTISNSAPEGIINKEVSLLLVSKTLITPVNKYWRKVKTLVTPQKESYSNISHMKVTITVDITSVLHKK
jgi:hypothetical protein